MLKEKLVLVTGASRGIGRAIALTLGSAGATVIGTATSDEGAANISKIFNENNILGKGMKLNVTDNEQISNVLKAVTEEYGTVDILINNAANDQRHTIDEVTEEYWEDRINVNLKHFFFTIQAVKKSMIENLGGAIVNMGSVSWMMGEGGMPAYTTSKAAILGMTRSFARDLGPYNIRVNSVVPGSIATERQIKMWLTPEYKKLILDKQCLKRQLTPAEVAQVVMFYSSDQSSGCTNHYYMVDAGII